MKRRKQAKRPRNIVIDGTVGQSHTAYPPDWKGGVVPVEVIEMHIVDKHGNPLSAGSNSRKSQKK
jgi:hypothetical protein